jgi:hypothetical protein
MRQRPFLLKANFSLSYRRKCVENSNPTIETTKAVAMRIENSVKLPIQSQCMSMPNNPREWQSRIPQMRTSEIRGYLSRKNKMPKEAAEKRNNAAYL